MKTELLKVLQAQLKKLGYYNGVIDGMEGPMTRNAVIEFKRANGLAPRDFVGPITVQTLFEEDAKPAPKPRPGSIDPLWLVEAQRLRGVKEVRGKGNNPVIMDWADQLDQWYPGDDVPWCGLFVAHCMSVGAPDEPQDFNRLGARNWLQYGEPCRAQVGAIAVFWRTHPKKSWNGHVGFVVGEDASTLHILGGNQSDAVTITRISKSRLLGCRAPAGWSGGSSKLTSVATGAVSTNEA